MKNSLYKKNKINKHPNRIIFQICEKITILPLSAIACIIMLIKNKKYRHLFLFRPDGNDSHFYAHCGGIMHMTNDVGKLFYNGSNVV